MKELVNIKSLWQVCLDYLHNYYLHTYMTIQEYTQTIQDSSIGESTKKEIITLLESADDIESVKDQVSVLLQKDIEEMLLEEADDEGKAEIAALDEKMGAELKEIETEIEAGVAEVEAEFAEIEQLSNELHATEQQVQIVELKDTLSSQG